MVCVCGDWEVLVPILQLFDFATVLPADNVEYGFGEQDDVDIFPVSRVVFADEQVVGWASACPDFYVVAKVRLLFREPWAEFAGFRVAVYPGDSGSERCSHFSLNSDEVETVAV